MSTKKEGTITAELWIESDELNPNAVSEHLGVKPTTFQIKGSLTASGASRFKRNSWSLSFGEHAPEFFHNAVRPKIFDFITAKEASLAELHDMHRCTTWLNIAVRISAHHIGLLIDSKEMLAASQARIGLDISIY